MTRKLIVYPVFFALFPVARLYSRNLSIIPAADVLRPAALMVAAVLVVWLLFGLVLRSAARGAGAASVAALMFFAYDPIRVLMGHARAGEVLPLWTVVTLLLVGAAAWNWKKQPIALFNFVGFVLLAMAVLQASSGLLHIRADQAKLPLKRFAEMHIAAGRPPDIFYIILDGYGRSDALAKYIGLDNSDFIGALRKRGFVIAQGHSNYSQTEQSLSSSLNMQYLPQIVGNIDPVNAPRAIFDRLIDKNEVAARLRSRGYLYMAVTTGFPSVHPSSADVLFESRSQMSLFEATLLASTPLRQDDNAVTSMFTDRRRYIEDAFANLRGLAPRAARPRFVFAHILAPHPPFVFDAQGNPVRQAKLPWGLFDGDAYMDVGGTVQSYQDGYRAQASFIDKETLAVVDALTKGPNPPVIIIQGDHGSKSRMSINSLAKTDLNECYANLNAYLVPESVKQKLYPTITPVNSFRVLLSSLFGDDLPLLPDKSYFSTWDRPFEYTEVTTKLKW